MFENEQLILIGFLTIPVIIFVSIILAFALSVHKKNKKVVLSAIELKRDMQELEAQKLDLVNQNQEKETAIGKLKAENLECKKEITRLSSLIENLSKSLNILREDIQEITEQNSKLNRMNDDYAKITPRLHEINRKLELILNKKVSS